MNSPELAGVVVRRERGADATAIGTVIARAFADHPFSDHTEPALVERLRCAGALTVSLVAEDRGSIVGHVAASAVTLDGTSAGWYGLGPVAVEPTRQRRGIGTMLVRAAIEELRAIDAAGCVVLGDPAYYARFGFASGRGLVYPGPPADHFMALAWHGATPHALVAYHAAFASPDAGCGSP